MAFGRRPKTLVASADGPEPRRSHSLIASAIRTNISDLSYNLWKFRDESWQRELWRYYDIIPEFGFASRWVGQCCSRVRIYVARVDELGRVQGEVKDPKINALADTLLGGPAAKAEALRNLGINLTVAGECYIVGRPGEEDSISPQDEWYVLSATEMRRVQSANGEWQWAWYLPDGNPFTLDLEHNVITRVWTPHPARVWCADSPSRSCQPVLRELEQLTKYVFSQIDSRLIGAGILVIPNNLDMPAEQGTTNNSESLMVRLATAGAASLRGEGSALGVLPHIVESDNPDGWKLLTFESALSAQAMQLRQEAVQRLGVGMDMPPEVLNGLGESNHWSGFLIDGYGIKVHIEPLMNRICDALTKAYLTPALKLMGKDPARYTYAFDTSPLTLRPQRLQDALNLYEKGVINAETLRAEGYFKESSAPTPEEAAKNFFKDLLLRDPQLIQNAAVREVIGITEDILPQSAMVAPTPESISMGPGGTPLGPGDQQTMGPSGPPAPPVPPTGIQSQLPPPIPDTLDQTVNGGPPTGILASSFHAINGISPRQVEEMGVVVVAESAIRRALELAGKRLLSKDQRNRWPDVPTFELHTRIKVEDVAHANRLLLGAWDQLFPMTQFVAPSFDIEMLQTALHKYCTRVLITSVAHNSQELPTYLRAEGVLRAI